VRTFFLHYRSLRTRKGAEASESAYKSVLSSSFKLPKSCASGANIDRARVCDENNQLSIQHATAREPDRSHSDAASSNARARRRLRHGVKAGDGASYIVS